MTLFVVCVILELPHARSVSSVLLSGLSLLGITHSLYVEEAKSFVLDSNWNVHTHHSDLWLQTSHVCSLFALYLQCVAMCHFNITIQTKDWGGFCLLSILKILQKNLFWFCGLGS